MAIPPTAHMANRPLSISESFFFCILAASFGPIIVHPKSLLIKERDDVRDDVRDNRITGVEHRVKTTTRKLTTGYTVSVHRSNAGGTGNDNIPKTDPQQKLVHRTTLQESIVGINGVGDGFERVHISWNTVEVSGDETHNSQHSSAAVTDLRLTEPGHERSISLREFQLQNHNEEKRILLVRRHQSSFITFSSAAKSTYGIELERFATKVDRTIVLVHYCLNGSGLSARLSGGEGTGASGEGKESGGGLHGSCFPVEMKKRGLTEGS